MARVAHLIMAHKEPGQIERLIKALSHENFDFYVHLDKKVDLKAYAYLQALPNVRFTNRYFVRWASYSFTSAFLKCTREILESGTHYDFVNLLSAQDYPIKPASVIHDFFENNREYSFLSFEKEGSEWWEGAIDRVQKYHLVNYKFAGQYQFQEIFNRLMPKRTFPLPYTLYGSSDSSWWSINAVCARYLVDFIEQNPRVRRFAKFTWGSDEFLIATILMNSPYKDKIVNKNYRYIDWSAGGANPKVLTAADFESFIHSDNFFARKFDFNVDKSVLDQIDYSINCADKTELIK